MQIFIIQIGLHVTDELKESYIVTSYAFVLRGRI